MNRRSQALLLILDTLRPIVVDCTLCKRKLHLLLAKILQLVGFLLRYSPAKELLQRQALQILRQSLEQTN